MAGDDLGIERAEDLKVGDVRIGVADGLGDEAASQAGQAEPPEAFGDLRRDQAEAADLADEAAVDPALGLARHIAGRDALGGEAARGQLDRVELVREGRIHACTPLRAPGDRRGANVSMSRTVHGDQAQVEAAPFRRHGTAGRTVNSAS